MSFTSGPYSPVAGQPFTAQNPAAGSGNLSSQAAVVKNVSPYLLQVADGGGSIAGLIDPYTTDLVPLSPTTGQQLEVTPLDLGLLPAASVAPSVFITWWSQQETVPGNYPFALPLTTIINDTSTPIPVVTVGSMAYASLTGPGETETPGALTQAGDLLITNADGYIAYQFSADGSIQLGYDNGAGGPPGPGPYPQSLFEYLFNRTTEVSNDWSIGVGGSFAVGADSLTLTADTLGLVGPVTIQGLTGSTVIRVGDNLLAFFDETPVGRQVSGGTTAGVIAGLVNLGLFSS